MSDLPAWASWAQALGVPVFGAIISCVGLRIAWLQKHLQDIRLQIDLYDRRFRIYAAAKGLLVSVQADGSVKRTAFQVFVDQTSDAEFLFAPNVADYLKELRAKAIDSIRIETKLSNGLGQKEHDRLAQEESEIATWFMDQFDILRDKFKPFMRLEHHV